MPVETTSPEGPFAKGAPARASNEMKADRGVTAQSVLLFVMYVALAANSAWVSYHSRKEGLETAAAFQHRIFLGDRSEGFRSQVHATRLLFPSALHYLSSATGLPISYSFALLRFASILGAYLLLHYYFRAWFDPVWSFVGVLLAALGAHVTFIDWFELPTEFLELFTTTLGFLCIRSPNYIGLLIVLAVATLSRETSGYLAIVYLFYELRMGPPLKAVGRTSLLCIVWAAIYLGMKERQGVEALHYFWNEYHFAKNITGLRLFLANGNPYNNYLSWLYLFGPMWVLAPWRLRDKPVFLQSAVVTVPVLLVIYLTNSAVLDEAREIVNLIPVIVPAALWSIRAVLAARPSENASGA